MSKASHATRETKRQNILMAKIWLGDYLKNGPIKIKNNPKFSGDSWIMALTIGTHLFGNPSIIFFYLNNLEQKLGAKMNFNHTVFS